MDVEVDISDRFGEVRDQGPRLTCLAFAATAAHEYCQRLVQPLSVEWIYVLSCKQMHGMIYCLYETGVK